MAVIENLIDADRTVPVTDAKSDLHGSGWQTGVFTRGTYSLGKRIHSGKDRNARRLL
jgi:hypothetical protein